MLPEAVDAVLARALAKAPGGALRHLRRARRGARRGARRRTAGARDRRSRRVAAPGARPASAAARALPGAPARRPRAGARGARGALAAARDGRRVVVCLAGEPGIGKSRLAAELAARAYDAGATVLYGRADEDPVIPYEPFAEALRELIAHLDIRRLPPRGRGARAARARARTCSARSRRPVTRAPTATGCSRASLACSRYAGRASPVVLVLEDLQWADKASLLLLRHVLESAPLARLGAIVSYRPLWVGDDHPLPDVLSGLARRHDVRQVALAGLTPEETGRLAADRLGHEPSPALVDALVERTSGNPLFVEELLRDAPEDPAATTTALPETVRHVVRRRLERLSEPTQRALAVAALLGGEFASARRSRRSSARTSRTRSRRRRPPAWSSTTTAATRSRTR